MSDTDDAATSYRQTDQGILPRSALIPLEIKGTEKGMRYLRACAASRQPLDRRLVCKVHLVSFKPVLPQNAGKFRTIQVTYSGKEAPQYAYVPTLVQQVCDDINFAWQHLPDTNDSDYIDRVVELVAHFHHRFVWIHPFVDYNGRMSRMLTNYLLMCLRLPVIEIPVTLAQDRKHYVRSLQHADEGDYTPLQQLLSRALTESLQSISSV